MWPVPGLLRYLTFYLRSKMMKLPTVVCVPCCLFHACRFLPAKGPLPQPCQWTCSQRLLADREEGAPAPHRRPRGGCRRGIVNLCAVAFSTIRWVFVPAFTCHWWSSKLSGNSASLYSCLCVSPLLLKTVELLKTKSSRALKGYFTASFDELKSHIFRQDVDDGI